MATPCVLDHITNPSTMHSCLHLVLPPCPLPLQWVLVTRRVLITLHGQQTMPIEPALIYYSILSGSCTFTFYILCPALLIDDLELGCQARMGSNIDSTVSMVLKNSFQGLYTEFMVKYTPFQPTSFRVIVLLLGAHLLPQYPGQYINHICARTIMIQQYQNYEQKLLSIFYRNIH